MSVALHERQWRHRLMSTREATLAAEGHRGLVGYVSAQRTRGRTQRDEAEIATLYLLRSAQGTGLGRALFIAGARVMAARGAGALVLWVLRDNLNARGFYERLGGVVDLSGGRRVRRRRLGRALGALSLARPEGLARLNPNV